MRYPNLEKVMREKNISIASAAATIGMPEPTFRGKIKDNRPFSVDEALSLKFNLFPEFEVKYLFYSEFGSTE